jgi:hypothetical protein
MKRKNNLKKIRILQVLFAVMLICVPAYMVNVVSGQTGEGDTQNLSDWVLEFHQIFPDNNAIPSGYVYSPFETVHLSAMVTNKGEPRANMMVAFKVTGPDTSSHPITIIRTAETDINGTATAFFRLPAGNNPENPALGNWQAFCSVQTTIEILQKTAQLTTKLPLIIQEIKILNQNGNSQQDFSNGQIAKIQIDIKNQKSAPIDANLRIEIIDNQDQVINEVISNQRIGDSGGTLEGELEIPDNCPTGNLTVKVHIYTIIEGQDIPICVPKTSKIEIQSHDLAITDALIYNTEFKRGDIVNITIVILNKGSVAEKQIIQIDYDHHPIDTVEIEILPQQEKTVYYAWNTSDVLPGIYEVHIIIPAVEGERNLNDNSLTAGTITITQPITYSVTPPEQTTSLFMLVLFFTGMTTLTLMLALRKRRNANISITPT